MRILNTTEVTQVAGGNELAKLFRQLEMMGWIWIGGSLVNPSSIPQQPYEPVTW